MMRKKILSLVLLMLPLSVSAQEGKFDWTPVMDAIIKVESRGNAKAHNPVGDCAGILQITPGLVRACNNILKQKKSTKRYTLSDRYNASKSKEMFILMQETFNPEHNVEKAIRCWNCGFGKGWQHKSTGYLKKVLRHYKKEAE
jgi:hypothetical protein